MFQLKDKTAINFLFDKTVPMFLHSLVIHLFKPKLCPIIYNNPVHHQQQRQQYTYRQIFLILFLCSGDLKTDISADSSSKQRLQSQLFLKT